MIGFHPARKATMKPWRLCRPQQKNRNDRDDRIGRQTRTLAHAESVFYVRELAGGGDR